MFLSLLLSTTLITAARSDQSIIESPSSSQVLRGGDILLKCTVRGQEGAVQWTQNGFGLGTDRQLAMFGRYSMVGNSDEYHLRIRNVRLEDDGVYQCQLMATATQQAKLSNVATLKVLVAPTTPRLTLPSPIGAIEGQPVNMACVVDEARPSPKIEWVVSGDKAGTKIIRMLGETNVTRKNSTTVSLVSSSTVQNDVISKNGVYFTTSRLSYVPMAGDDGAYVVCRVSHPALQRPLMLSNSLDIQYAPLVTVHVNQTALNHSTRSSLREGEGALLQCDVNARPDINIKRKWYRDGVPIENAYTRMLAITVLDRSFQNSQFTCEAENVIGNGRSIIKLQVEYSARITYASPTQASVEGGTITLECETDSNPPALVTWSRIEGNHEGRVLHTGKSYTISKLKRHHQGTYKCTANTPTTTTPKFASSYKTMQVLVNGPPRVRGLRSTARLNGEARIQCEIYGYPFPTDVSWSRVGSAGVIDTYRNDRYRETTKESVDSIISTLHITNAEDADFVEYNCSARNQYGMHSDVVYLRQGDIVPLYLAVPAMVAAALFICLIIACICVMRRCCCNRKSLNDSHTDVTVKVETLDGRAYPDMYGTTAIDSSHVTYGKDYMAVPQDNPDLDLLPPPYAHYSIANPNNNGGVLYTNSLQRITPPNSQLLVGNPQGLVAMTYLDGPAISCTQSQDGTYSPPMRNGTVLAPMTYAVRNTIPRVTHVNAAGQLEYPPIDYMLPIDGGVHQPLLVNYNPYGVVCAGAQNEGAAQYTNDNAAPLETVPEMPNTPDTDNTTATTNMSPGNSPQHSNSGKKLSASTNV